MRLININDLSQPQILIGHESAVLIAVKLFINIRNSLKELIQIKMELTSVY